MMKSTRVPAAVILALLLGTAAARAEDEEEPEDDVIPKGGWTNYGTYRPQGVPYGGYKLGTLNTGNTGGYNPSNKWTIPTVPVVHAPSNVPAYQPARPASAAS
jgi:hypothetical protein